jgi:tRNA(fMet)-specific endonuclease VapC
LTARYLLDTNILSDVVRNPDGAVARRIAMADDRVCTSIIVAAELRYGAARKGSARLTGRVQALLEAIEILPFEPPADERYGAMRAQLESNGRPIGLHDYLIAAQALSAACILVTANEREFRRVPGLTVENWLR